MDAAPGDSGVTMRTSDPWAFFIHNLGLFGTKTLDHLGISFAATGAAVLLAVPLGVWLGHLHRFSLLAISISNVGRALPSLAVVALFIAFLGIGFVNAAAALLVLAGPVILTNAYVAVDQVDPDAVQAAQAMGMTATQVLWRVEIPLALPLIFAGVRTATVYVIATATLATFAGGGGLGDIVVNEASYGTGGVIAGSLAIAVLAFASEAVLAVIQRVVTPVPLRTHGRRASVKATTQPALTTSD